MIILFTLQIRDLVSSFKPLKKLKLHVYMFWFFPINRHSKIIINAPIYSACVFLYLLVYKIGGCLRKIRGWSSGVLKVFPFIKTSNLDIISIIEIRKKNFIGFIKAHVYGYFPKKNQANILIKFLKMPPMFFLGCLFYRAPLNKPDKINLKKKKKFWKKKLT